MAEKPRKTGGSNESAVPQPKAERLERRRTEDRRRQQSPSNENSPSGKEYDPWKILMYPHLAEKSMKMVEAENKLVFMVRRNSHKSEIKEAIEKAFAVKVTKVNFEITMTGQKKAYVKLGADFSASDIATRMGMV